ncbi:hypothetical protein [Sporosarcina ureilytica]|uniref:Uncharacterized protein n=1 Tax=Sporosarcina ureilytica TaxID=298596 RepID=A0A1D8JJ55_9BACL|nr:hypothetical protein [Sporosarcina ureilytica]AOV08739.1 hypothetical protein BI350_15110 [Sporosarcina ureilytica]
MKTMKRNWIMIIAFAVIISGIGGLVSPKEAEASWLFTNRSGYFSNYVETQNYQGTYSSSSNVKSVSIMSGTITANSTAGGTFVLYIQKRPYGTSQWQTIRTVFANKNGTTHFESPKFSPRDGYRFKLVNLGIKNRVNYKMQWIPWASAY